MDKDKELLLLCLRGFIKQKPGLQFCNYGDVSAYRAEMRSITKDRHEAERLLDNVAWRDSITANDIIEASKRAYSGRLTITRPAANGCFVIDYCTGQYFPTEYRRAVCAVLASTLWDYWRDGNPYGNNPGAGDYVRDVARREFGRGIASRWFN